jgi:hypothetical protein
VNIGQDGEDCEDTKAETGSSIGEQRLVKLNKASDLKKETDSINLIYKIFPNICFLSHVCSKIMKYFFLWLSSPCGPWPLLQFPIYT